MPSRSWFFVPRLTQNTYHRALPFCHFIIRTTRTALRYRKLFRKGFMLKSVTLGQHLRAKRLLLNLTQKQVAMRLNTLREHYERWERDEVAPTASFWPRLIDFIGGYPFSVETSAELVLKARRMLGLSQYAFGRKVQAIAEDVRKWEHGVSEPSSVVLAKVRSLIADTPVVDRDS